MEDSMSGLKRFSIDKYISGKYSICREERQYALYLNNILMKYRKKAAREKNDTIKKIFKSCGLDAIDDIKYVFYEATFMRDVFERNRRMQLNNQSKRDSEKTLQRRKEIVLQNDYNPTKKNIENKEDSFDAKLIEFMKNNGLKFNGEYSGEEYNMGSNHYDHGEDAKSMMNSKPDIAVIFKIGEQHYLHFIECKFESSESTHGDLKQSEIQWYIADFLCENCFNGVKVSPKMKNNKSCLVRFTRKKNEENNKNEICIKDLISLNNKIFGINCDNDNTSEKKVPEMSC